MKGKSPHNLYAFLLLRNRESRDFLSHLFLKIPENFSFNFYDFENIK